jgi:hypothetical protein
MISSESFSKEWIDQFRKQKGFSKVNPPILEKMIHALSLLEALRLSGMEFILKGGSSLILLLEQPGRFSVDIDILTTHPREELEKIQDKVIKESHFTRYELDDQRSFNEGVPKAHYAFSYQAEFNKKANYILLDILFEKSAYPEVIEVPIKTRWLKTDNETIFVKVPSVESITGGFMGSGLIRLSENAKFIVFNNGFQRAEKPRPYLESQCLRGIRDYSGPVYICQGRGEVSDSL